MTSQPVDPASDAPANNPERRQLTVRRAPKFVPFLIAGAIVAAIVAGILTAFSPSTQEYATTSVFGFFFVMLLIPGVGVGAVAALVIDRISIRRAETAIVESVPEENSETVAESTTTAEAAARTQSETADVVPASDSDNGIWNPGKEMQG